MHSSPFRSILDIETRTWSHPLIIGTAPAARCAHSANMFEGKLIVFGGGDGNRRFKDLYLVDSGTRSSFGTKGIHDALTCVTPRLPAESRARSDEQAPAAAAAEAFCCGQREPQRRTGIGQWQQ